MAVYLYVCLFVFLCWHRCKSPNRTLATRIHARTDRALVSGSKLWRIGQWAEDTDRSRRMHRRSNLSQCVLWSHRPAPDLSVVEEKQLVVAHFHPFKKVKAKVKNKRQCHLKKKYWMSTQKSKKEQKGVGTGRWTETFHVQSLFA